MDSFTEDIMARSATESQRLYLGSLGADFPDSITVSQAFKAIDKIEEDDIAKSRVEVRDDGSVRVVDLESKNKDCNSLFILAFALMVMLVFVFMMIWKVHGGISGF